MNILLHAIVTVLVYDVVRCISGAKILALFVAAIFVAHPVNVEVVAWISQRKTLLSSLFFFSSILAYIHWRRDPKKIWYILALAFSALSVLSKTATVLLPVILISYELLIIREQPVKWITLLPFALVSLAGAGGSILTGVEGRPIVDNTFTYEFLFELVYPTMIPVYSKYILLLVAPVNLSAFYDTTIYRSLFEPVVLLSVSIYLYVFVMVLRFGGKKIHFWAIWSVVCFLPTANIIPIPVYFADRYMYLPLIGFFACIAIGIRGLYHWLHSKYELVVPITVSFTISIAFVCVLVIMSFNRIDVWRNELSLWGDTVQKSPDIYNVRMNYGAALKRARKYNDALEQFEYAAKLHPSHEAVREIRALQELLIGFSE